MNDKRFCQASENNKGPILEQLKKHFSRCHTVLEIGSGTGQHAAYFSQHLPHLQWHTSDMPDNHPGITAWLEEAGVSNGIPPVAFTIGQDDWPLATADAVFTANTAHIMQADVTQLMMEMVSEHLPSHGVFCQYGPFTVNGEYTSDGNRSFDRHLIMEGCGGMRDIQELVQWAGSLTLVHRVAMPANNFLLVWRKDTSS